MKQRQARLIGTHPNQEVRGVPLNCLSLFHLLKIIKEFPYSRSTLPIKEFL